MTERHKLVPASYLVLLREGKILLLRRFNTGYEDGKYSMIAGHLDGDETFIQTIVRESKEEAGITIKPEDLKVVHVMHRKVPTHERVDVFLQAARWEGEPQIMEPHKCDDLRWFDEHRLPDNVIPYVRQAIDSVRKGNIYSEHGW